MANELEQQFDVAMMDIYRRAKTEAHYNASRYFQMLTQYRGLETARILLRADSVSEDYTALWNLGRLDLTVEALIHDHPEYRPLFTDEERETARLRLKQYQYPLAIDPIDQFIGAFASNTPNWTRDVDEHLGQKIAEEMRPQNGNGD
jgi:hypothetical protein